MSDPQQHERAVAQSLSWAAEAAERNDFADALAWLAVVEAVDGELAPEWQRAQASWASQMMTAARSRASRDAA